MMICPACNIEVPETPRDLNCPREARCFRDHSIIEGCPYEQVKSKNRGNWVAEVFQPLPEDEAEALRKYLPGYD